MEEAIGKAYEHREDIVASEYTLVDDFVGYGATSEEYSYTYGLGYMAWEEEDYDGSLYSNYVLESNTGCIYLCLNEEGGFENTYDDYLYPGILFDETFGYEDRNVYYGAEAFLRGLYQIASTSTYGSLVNLSDEEGYAFSMVSFAGEARSYYYAASVSFTLGEHEELSSLEVKVDSYYPENVDSFDAASGSVTLKDGVSAYRSVTRSITQTYGTRQDDCPFDVDAYFISSFGLLREDGSAIENGSTITAMVDDSFILSLGNVTPQTASFSVDTPSVRKFKNGVEFTENTELRVHLSSYDHTLTVYPYAAGEYEIRVYTAFASFTFTLRVYGSLPSRIDSVTYYRKNSLRFGSGTLEEGSSFYVGEKIYLLPSVYPLAAEQSCLLSVEGPAGSTVSYGQDEEVDINGTTRSLDYVELSEAGSYTLTYVSSVDSTVSRSYVVEALPAPTLGEILTRGAYGLFLEEELAYQAEFVPSGDSDLSGSVSLIDYSAGSSPVTYSYRATSLQNGGYSIEIVDGPEGVSLYIGGDSYDFVIEVDATSYPFELLTAEVLFAGTYSVTTDDETEVSIVFEGNGTFVATASNYGTDYLYLQATGTWSLVGETLTLTVTGGSSFFEASFAYDGEASITGTFTLRTASESLTLSRI